MPPDSVEIKINADDNTQTVFRELTQRVVQLEKENQKLENRLTSVSQRVTKYRADLVSLDRRHTTTRNRVTRLTASMKELQDEVERVTKDFDNLEVRQQRQANTLREVQIANKTLTTELQKVQTQLEKVRTSSRNTGQAQESLADRTLTASTVFNDFAGSLFQVSGLLQRLGNIGFEAVREFGRAALEIDRARESFIALGESVAVADNRIEELWELAQLPGVTFRGALQSAQLLEAVGVSARDASQLIIEFGNAIELSGRTQVDFRETLRQVSQGISRNKIQQEELNVIFERAPIIARAVKEAYGTIDPETITARLKEAGETAEDFWRLIAHETLPSQARANILSLQNQVTNLQNAFEQLKQGLGTALIPEIQTLTSVTRGLLDRFNELSPSTQRTVAVATTGATFFAKFGGAILETVANIGLAIFGIRQMRGSLRQMTTTAENSRAVLNDLGGQELQSLRAQFFNLDNAVKKGETSYEDAIKVFAKMSDQFNLTSSQMDAIIGTTGNLALAATLTRGSIAGTGKAVVGLGATLLRFLPYVGGAVAVLGVLGLILSKVGKETNTAKKETEEFEEALERASTRTGVVAEFDRRIETLIRYRNALTQGRAREVPEGTTLDLVNEQIAALTAQRNFFRDSDLPAFQKRFTDEIDANTTRLEEIFKRQDEILRELGTEGEGIAVRGGVLAAGQRQIESPSLINVIRASRVALIREFQELQKESEGLEKEITRVEEIFINLERAAKDALKGGNEEMEGAIPIITNYVLHLTTAQDVLNRIRESVTQATSEAGVQAAAENAKRLVDEIADLERQQALERENARAVDKRNAEQLAAEINQININAANTKLDIDRNAAAQSVNIYRTALQAIRSEASSAATVRQALETAEASIDAINKITEAQRQGAMEQERLRDATIQDEQALNRELLRIDQQGASQRLDVYEQLASQTASVLSSVLDLVTDRQSLNQYESEIDRLIDIAIRAVRDVELEEIEQAVARENRRSVEEKDEDALAKELVEIRRRANARILAIEKSFSDISIQITRDELDERIKLFQDFEARRRAFTDRGNADDIKLTVENARVRRDEAKKALDDILALETSSTDDRIDALDNYQKAAEEYNRRYLYQYQQTNVSAVDLAIKTAQVEKDLILEVQQFREDINKRKLANEQKLNQSVIDTQDQTVLREFEREQAANEQDLQRKAKQRREEERLARQSQRDEERERNRMVNEERRALSQRLQDYTNFYNALRNLDVSSVENALLGIARVTADYIANLATRAAADAAYAKQKLLLDSEVAGASATAQAASFGLTTLLGNPLAIAAVLGSIGLSFFARRQANRQQPTAAAVNTRTFHDASADFLAEVAGREAARLTPQQTMMNRRQNARDFTNSFMDGYEDEMRQRSSAGGGDDREYVINLNLNDKTLQQIRIRESQMVSQGRIPRGRRR